MTQTENIIYQNLFSLIRNGYFMEKNEIIAMSKWKWQRLNVIAERNGLKGLSEKIQPQIDTAAIIKEHHELLNRWTERRRQSIFHDERHAIDTSTESLDLLNIIIYNISEIEAGSISLIGLITLGNYLRTMGHKVDFVKVDSWIEHLHIKKMASLLGSMLVAVMGFDVDEIPFLYKEYSDAYERLCKEVSKMNEKSNISRSYSLITYSPMEFIGLCHNKLKMALDSIEE